MMDSYLYFVKKIMFPNELCTQVPGGQRYAGLQLPISCILIISVSRYLMDNGMQDYNYLYPVSNILMSSVSRYLVDNGMQDYNYLYPVA